MTRVVLVRHLEGLAIDFSAARHDLDDLACIGDVPVGAAVDDDHVRDILKDPAAASLVYAIVQLAHGMSLATVAEYVESDEPGPTAPYF